jgi:phage-related protein
MKHRDFEFNGPSRSNQRAKRRKTNLILNSLIVIVLLLIIIVSFSIFFSNGDEATGNASNQHTETSLKDKEEASTSGEGDEANKADEQEAVETSSPVDANTESESETELDETITDVDETVTEPETEDIVTEGSTDPNVKSTITNPDWQPVGTAQTGQHVAVYNESSIDWQEMLKAVSYGTGIDDGNMTVWFLGRNKQGAENQSVATVSTKDNSQTYRVFIEWVDNQGWKPVKIEELYER